MPEEKKETFSTGAVRSELKQRLDLISPIAMRRLGLTCDEGAKKYSEFNWEKGIPIKNMLNHALVHLFQFLAGDESEDHLAHAAWNVMHSMHSQELWPELNEEYMKAIRRRHATIVKAIEEHPDLTPPCPFRWSSVMPGVSVSCEKIAGHEGPHVHGALVYDPNPHAPERCETMLAYTQKGITTSSRCVWRQGHAGNHQIDVD